MRGPTEALAYETPKSPWHFSDKLVCVCVVKLGSTKGLLFSFWFPFTSSLRRGSLTKDTFQIGSSAGPMLDPRTAAEALLGLGGGCLEGVPSRGFPSGKPTTRPGRGCLCLTLDEQRPSSATNGWHLVYDIMKTSCAWACVEGNLWNHFQGSENPCGCRLEGYPF